MISVSLATRAGTAALGCAVLASLLTGCGGSEEDASEDEPTAESTSDATEPTDATPTEGYLPVPSGVTLTQPGTELAFGVPATVAWQPRQDRVVALDLTVERIDETSFEESFDGWVVTREMKDQTPYFVHVKATNVSETDVGGLLVPLYALSDGTSLFEPLSFTRKVFEPCPGGELPDRLRPDRSADLCLVYLLPAGQPLKAAAFDLVGGLEPITWTGEVTAIDDGKNDKKKGKNKRRQRG